MNISIEQRKEATKKETEEYLKKCREEYRELVLTLEYGIKHCPKDYPIFLD